MALKQLESWEIKMAVYSSIIEILSSDGNLDNNHFLMREDVFAMACKNMGIEDNEESTDLILDVTEDLYSYILVTDNEGFFEISLFDDMEELLDYTSRLDYYIHYVTLEEDKGYDCWNVLETYVG